MIPRYKPYLKIADLLNFLHSPKVPMSQVEEKFAQRANCKYAVILPYGRSAYYFLLKAYGYKNKEVILPAYTCSVLAGPVKETQNTPVFVDSSSDGYNMAPDKLAQSINEKTRMILFTEIWGDPLSFESLTPYQGKDILLVGDYSLSLFSYFENNGETLKSLDAAFFSFALGKEISALGGGIIITDNEEIFNKVKHIRDSTCTSPNFFRSAKIALKMFAVMTALSRLFYRPFIYLSEKTTLLDKLKTGDEGISTNIPGDFFVLPTNSQLYIINDRLDNVDEFITERRRVLQLYYDELKKQGVNGFYPFKLASNIALSCTEKNIKYIREELFNNGVHTAASYKKSLPAALNLDTSAYPNAEKLSRSLTMLPLFYGIGKTQIEQVVGILRKTLQKLKS